MDKLPRWIWYDIAKNLDGKSVIALRGTCRDLRNWLDQLALSRPHRLPTLTWKKAIFIKSKSITRVSKTEGVLRIAPLQPTTYSSLW